MPRYLISKFLKVADLGGVGCFQRTWTGSSSYQVKFVRDQEDLMKTKEMIMLLRIVRQSLSTNNNSTSLAPEFCCRSCISPTSFPVSEDSSGQLIISDPLLSQLLLLPWLCEAPTADCAKLLYMYLTKTSHLSPEYFEGRTFIIHKSITDVTTSSKFSSVRF